MSAYKEIERLLQAATHKQQVTFALACVQHTGNLAPEVLRVVSLLERWLQDSNSVSKDELERAANAASAAHAAAYAAAYAAYAATNAAAYAAAHADYAAAIPREVTYTELLTKLKKILRPIKNYPKVSVKEMS